MRKYLAYQRTLMQAALAKLNEIDTMEKLKTNDPDNLIQEAFENLKDTVITRMQSEYAELMTKLVKHTCSMTGFEITPTPMKYQIVPVNVVTIAEEVMS